MENLIINAFGDKIYRNSKGQYHRIGGPAVELANGDKYYYLNGKFHRVDGPAVEYGNGIKYWYYQGNHIQCSFQEEFERLIKLKVFW